MELYHVHINDTNGEKLKDAICTIENNACHDVDTNEIYDNRLVFINWKIPDLYDSNKNKIVRGDIVKREKITKDGIFQEDYFLYEFLDSQVFLFRYIENGKLSLSISDNRNNLVTRGMSLINNSKTKWIILGNKEEVYDKLFPQAKIRAKIGLEIETTAFRSDEKVIEKLTNFLKNELNELIEVNNIDVLDLEIEQV